MILQRFVNWILRRAGFEPVPKLDLEQTKQDFKEHLLSIDRERAVFERRDQSFWGSVNALDKEIYSLREEVRAFNPKNKDLSDRLANLDREMRIQDKGIFEGLDERVTLLEDVVMKIKRNAAASKGRSKKSNRRKR